MSFVIFAMLVLMGVAAGLGAWLVMERGGYGLRWDIILGLVGSLAGSWLFWAAGLSPGAGLVVVAVVGFVGAAVSIVAQRKIWPTVA